MPVTPATKARVDLAHLKNLRGKIQNTGSPEKAGGVAVEALDYLRDKGFRIKVEVLDTTREYEITIFAEFRNKHGKKILSVTGYRLWTAVDSAISHFLSKPT